MNMPSPSLPTLWRPLPTTVHLASLLLIAHAALVATSGVLVVGPIVTSRLTGIDTIGHASARAPAVWDAVQPLLVGFGLGLVYAGCQLWLARRLRATDRRARNAVCGVACLGLLLSVPFLWSTSGEAGLLFAFSGDLLAYVKTLLLALALLLLLVPGASRRYFDS